MTNPSPPAAAPSQAPSAAIKPAAAPTIPPEDITGLVLAGGRGSRMGGVDKGLQNHQGMPLALYTLLRLRTQVGSVMVNANRNIGAYEAFGAPVWPDSTPDFAGPLAGMLTGLEHCETPWLLCVPCDTPNFPDDLAARMAQVAADASADVVLAATRNPQASPPAEPQAQPVFCLLRHGLLESLIAYMSSGQRKIDRWTSQHRQALAVFDDEQAFSNANTLDELRMLAAPAAHRAR
jgi:molybdopterin-guanine dinucleotide biosynthesis protein A